MKRIILLIFATSFLVTGCSKSEKKFLPFSGASSDGAPAQTNNVGSGGGVAATTSITQAAPACNPMPCAVGSTVTVTVNFTEAVNVNGVPTLTLNNGTTATYVSGSGTKDLVFTYTLTAADNGVIPNYKDPSSLVLSNNSTITLVSSGTNANTTLPTPSTLASSATQATPTCSTSPCATGSVVNITVDFTEAVNVNGVPTLTLNNGKTATYVSGAGTKNLVFAYTLTATDNGVVPNYVNTTSLVLPTGVSITTVASGTVANTTLPMPAVLTDTTAPTINSVSATTANGTYVKDGKVYITVTMSEVVNVSGFPTLALNTGNSTSGFAVYSSGTGTNTLTFEYVVRSGDKVADLNYVATDSLVLNGGTIRDAANNTTALTLPATTAATSLAGAKDIALDTTPKVASITTTTANGSYAAGSVINFTVTFTDVVTTTGTVTLALANGKTATCTNVTNSTTMSCSYTVVQGDTSSDLTYQNTASLTGGTVASATNSTLTAVRTLPDPKTFEDAYAIVITDVIPSTVTGVSATNANATYAKDQIINVTLTFSETVTVTTGGGIPSIALNTGNATNGNAVYTSGSGSNTLTFQYTVRAGDKVLDLNYVATDSLALNGGTIKNAADTVATLTLPATTAATSLGGAKDIALDTTPTVTSITTTTANGTYGVGSVINFTVTFTDAVTTTGVVTLALANGKTATCTNVTNSTTMSCSYTVASGDTSADLTYQSTTSLTGGTVASSANASLIAVRTLPDPSTFAGIYAIVVDGTSLNISGVSATNANNTYTKDQVISVTVTFSKVVNVTGFPTIALNTGNATNGNATYTSGTGSNTLTFQYTVRAGDKIADLNYVATNSLALNGGSIKDALNNAAATDLPAIDAATSLGGAKNIALDTTPTVASITTTTANGTYGLGSVINFTVTFTDAVTTTGVVTLALANGKTATCVNVVNSTTMSCSYTVALGDTSADLTYQNTTSLTGGTVASGVNSALTAVRTLPAPTTFSDAYAIVVSALPTISFTSGTTSSVAENVAGGNYTLNFTLSGVMATDVTFTLASANGTATSGVGNDYTAYNSQTVTIPAGRTDLAVPISIAINNDGSVEGNETFTLTMSSPSANVTLAGGATVQTVTITDDDAPTLSFTQGATNAVGEAAGTYTVNFTLSAPIPTAVSFTLTSGTTGTGAGHAISGTDFVAFANNPVVIDANQTTKAVTVTITDDSRYEGNETFTLTMSNVTTANATISATSVQTVTITENEALPVVSLSAATYNGDEGTSIAITVKRDGVSDVDTTVTLATTITGPGTTHALANDFTSFSGLITIPKGALTTTTTTQSISTTADSLYESAETFSVGLSGVVTNGTLTGATNPSATVTINNDEAKPVVSFAAGLNTSIGEGAGNYTLNFSLTSAASTDVTFTLASANGTATSGGGNDYTAYNSQTVTIPAGRTNLASAISIAILEDTTYEGNETFTLTMSDVSANAVLNPALGGTVQTVTITDNDLGILSAKTLDTDNDGKIDAYQIVFSSAITDNTFPGYIVDAAGSTQTDWLIAGYTGLVLSNGTHAASAATAAAGGVVTSDGANDNTIYLRFTEGGSADTGVKPDLTTTATPGVTGTGGTLPQVATNTVTEQDGAKAVIVSAIGTESLTSLVVTFSEAVYTTTGIPACATAADITVADTTFANGNGAGVTSLTAVPEACGTDSIITYTTNTALLTTDNLDTIAYATATVYDAANNQISTTAKALTINASNVPTLESLKELDTDHDGKIDTLLLTFDKAMLDSTISANLAQCTVGGVAVTALNATTIVAPHMPTNAVDDKYVYLTVGSTIAAGTEFKTAIYTAGSWQSFAGGNLASFNFTGHNTSSTGVSTIPKDEAAPVIISAVAADPAPNTAGVDAGDTLTVTFSEAVSNFAAITNANITTLLSLSGSQTWPGITSAVWSNSNKTVTITFSGTGVIADDTVITAVDTNNKFVDNAVPNFYASSATMIGSFTTDVIKPYVLFATDISLASTYSTAVTVNTVNTTKASGATFLLSFNEAVKTDGGVNAANLVANYTIAGTLNGSAVTTPTIASVISYNGSSSVFLVTLTGDVFTGAEYTISGDNGLTPFTGSQAIKDLSSNDLTTPNTATLIANDEFRVLTAKAASTTSINVTMSKLVDSATATCTDAGTCAVKYYLTPSLGTITGASVSNNIISITISSSTMQGSVYTIVVANGVSTDDPTASPGAFDTGAGDAVQSGGVAVSGNPKDRMSFMGAGASIVKFESGWYMDDPFADGSVFSYTFNFRNKVFVGPNSLNNTTLRFNPNGSGIIGNFFSFTNNNTASLSCGFQPTNKTWGFGFETAYSTNTACDGTDLLTGPKYVGPLKEIGLVGFSSAKSTSGPEFLLVGPLKNNAGEGYFTEDTDNTLNMRSFTVPQFTGGANTQSIQTFYSYGTGLFIGYSTDLGTQSPILLRSEIGGTTTVTSLPGGNATGAKNFGTDTTGILARSGVSFISSGDAVGIDALLVHRDFLYVSSSTGIATTVDISGGFTTASNDDRFAGRALVTPAFATGSTLVLPGTKVAATVLEGLGKVSPGQKGIPFLKTHNNGLYMVRNVAQGITHTASALINELNKMPSYGEVYFCATPTGAVAHSDGGTKRYCKTSDWTKLFSTEDATFHGKTAACSAQGTSINCGNVTGCTWIAANSTCTAKEAISMFEINDQGVVYIGVDSPQGFRIYRNPTGTASNIPASSNWTQQGTSGLGSGYTHIQSATIIKDPDTATTNYMYITTGKHQIDTTTPANSLLWHAPIKVYRQGDVGTSVIVAYILDLKHSIENSNLLAFISKTRKNVPVMLLFSIVLGASVGLGLRRKYLKDHHLI